MRKMRRMRMRIIKALYILLKSFFYIRFVWDSFLPYFLILLPPIFPPTSHTIWLQ
jgi:hypothetical protein